MLCYKCGSHVPDGQKACPTCGQSLARPSADAGKSVASLIDDKRRRRSTTRAGAGQLSPGDLLSGRYKIIDPIGTGGVGAVYRAHDQDIDVDVALKAVATKLLQTAEEQKNFSQKIRLARKLHHANIVRIYDDGREGDQRYFTMQLLEGLTLQKVIELRRQKEQPFVAQEIVPIFEQLTTALEYAHRTTYHGDLKPSNIIILPDLLKLTDFCLIQALPLKPFLAIQKSRGSVFHYLAPEVRLEASRIDGRADIYSLGVILAEMLCGEVFTGVFDKSFTAASKLLPKGLEQVLRRALAEHPDGRFQTVGEFMEALGELIGAGELEALHGAERQPPPPPMIDDVDDDAVVEPELLTSSNFMLVQELEEGSQTDPDGLAPAPDHTPLERPPALNDDTLDELSDEEPRQETRDLRAPPPLPPDAIDDEEDEDEAPSPPPSALADEVRRVTGEGSDVYDRHTYVEEGLSGPAAKAAESSGGNGAGGSSIPSPPPLPPDAAEPFADDDGTVSEPGGPVGIHDELTALTPYPEPPPGRRSGPLPTPMPTVVPPPLAPVIPPMRKTKRERPYLLLALASVVLLAIIAYGFNYIQNLKTELNRQRVAQFTDTSGAGGVDALVDSADAGMGVDAGAVSASADATAGSAAADEEAKRLADEEAKRLADEEAKRLADEEARRLADEEAKRLADEEARRRAEEEAATAAKLDRNQASKTSAAARRRDEKRQADEERRRQREEAKRLADEARREREAEREAERERKAEEARRRAEEEARAKETRVAARAPEAEQELKCPRGMARIASGRFKMGSAGNDPMRNYEERRLESVEVATYCIDYYEYPNGKRALPKTNVSWNQAKTSCESRGKRLCSEEEWEKACKGSKSLRFPYGNRWDPALCNTEDADGNDRQLAVPVDFPRCRSGYGPIMMSGNAAEWTASSFAPGLRAKVHKGGAADRPNWAARCANRVSQAPGQKDPMLGFRCCADPE